VPLQVDRVSYVGWPVMQRRQVVQRRPVAQLRTIGFSTAPPQGARTDGLHPDGWYRCNGNP